MRKIAALCIAAVLLASCVGIDSRLTIRQDGSGILTLTYRISQLVTDLGVSSGEKGVVPLPLARADFERSLEGTGGKVRLVKFDRKENEKDITITAELSFDSLEALSHVAAFSDADLKASSDGSRRSFSQLIARAPKEEINEDSLRMIDTFFDGYNLTFTVEAPLPIQANTLGSLSADKRTLTYTSSIKDIVRTTTDVVLSLSW